MEAFSIVFKLLLAVGGSILINKTTQIGDFKFIKQHLRLSWTLYFLFLSILVFSDPHIWGEVMKLHKQFSSTSPLLQFIVIFIIGGMLLYGYWQLAGIFSPDSEQLSNSQTLSEETTAHYRAEFSKLQDSQKEALRKMLITKNANDVPDSDWQILESVGFVERNFTGKVGIKKELSQLVDQLLKEKIAEKPASQQIPTAEEIAKALKKEFGPQVKNSKMPKNPPPIDKAKREIIIKSLDQFNPGFGDKLKMAKLPGYFELSSGSSRGSLYSSFMIKTKENISTHYYTSIRMGGLENVNVMDFGGDTIICVDTGWNIFFIWEAEHMQEGWYPIKISSQKHPTTNTLGIYQKGRNVAFYVNNELIGEYVKLKTPAACPISVNMKANPLTGGKIHFESFAIWEFKP
jgi:hypothetical protein